MTCWSRPPVVKLTPSEGPSRLNPPTRPRMMRQRPINGVPPINLIHSYRFSYCNFSSITPPPTNQKKIKRKKKEKRMQIEIFVCYNQVGLAFQQVYSTGKVSDVNWERGDGRHKNQTVGMKLKDVRIGKLYDLSFVIVKPTVQIHPLWKEIGNTDTATVSSSS